MLLHIVAIVGDFQLEFKGQLETGIRVIVIVVTTVVIVVDIASIVPLTFDAQGHDALPRPHNGRHGSHGNPTTKAQILTGRAAAHTAASRMGFSLASSSITTISRTCRRRAAFKKARSKFDGRKGRLGIVQGSHRQAVNGIKIQIEIFANLAQALDGRRKGAHRMARNDAVHVE